MAVGKILRDLVRENMKTGDLIIMRRLAQKAQVNKKERMFRFPRRFVISHILLRNILDVGCSLIDKTWDSFHDVKIGDRSLIWNSDLIETVELENLLINACITMHSTQIRMHNTISSGIVCFVPNKNCLLLGSCCFWHLCMEKGNPKFCSLMHHEKI